MLDPVELTSIVNPAAQPQVHLRAKLEELDTEAAKRRIEALELYEPTPFQDQFHKCTAKEAMIQAGNQVGKSLANFVEVARAVTGRDPYDKYPKENGICICVAYDEQHIGTNLYRYLFRPGAFYIIRDKGTKRWRVWKPWIPEDMERIRERRPAPPLIPSRYIKGGWKGIAWTKRKENIFNQVEFVNGWILYARTSKGQPMAGIEVDLADIDEDLERAEWYSEMIARLTMRRGKMRWSSLPYAKNSALIDFVRRAEDEEALMVEAKQKGETYTPTTVVFRATVFDNPFMPPEERETNIKLWKSQGEDEYRKRALGELVTDSWLMYPTFSTDAHNLFNERADASPAQQILTSLANENGMVEPPEDWCLYATIDPGHTVMGTLFFAVPPPHLKCDQVVVYDELYIQRCDDDMWGTQFEFKVKGRTFQRFIFDMHGGNLRPVFGGKTPTVVFTDQLIKRDIRCVESGSGFRPGSDDIKGRELVLRNWLAIRPDGTPKLLVNMKRCPNLVREFQKFQKKRTADGFVTDDGDRRKWSHLIECCEYGAADGLMYIRPPLRVVRETFVERVLRDRATRAAVRRARGSYLDSHVTLGPQGVPQ